jgi:hypothetical protein
MRAQMPDCYDYVRRYYQVPAYVGVKVKAGDKAGVLVNRSGAGQYVYVKWDGDKRVPGPYHPTDVEYQP